MTRPRRDLPVAGKQVGARSRTGVGLIVVALLAWACGGSDEPGSGETVDDGADETDETFAESATSPSATNAAGTPPDGPPNPGVGDVAIEPGGLATGEVTIDGQVIDYVTVTPFGFRAGDTAPVMLAFPPGGQDAALTESVVDGVYRTEALDRGWVVVSPARPRGGSTWFGSAEALAPSLMDWIGGWVTPEGGGYHVVGVSNGGLSSFRIAGENPDRVRSVLVFPGYPRSEEDRAALAELTEVPVRLFVGADDTTWIPPMEETAATLEANGGDVELVVLAGEGHIIGSLSDGVRIFDELDAAR